MPKLGFITPSQYSKIMQKSKSGDWFSNEAIKYGYETAAAFWKVQKEEQKSKATEHGKVYEFEALRAYEKVHFVELEVCEFTTHPLFAFLGGTADSKIIKSAGLVDSKCPFAVDNHLKNLDYGYQIDDYYDQFQGYMSIYEKEFLDMISYDPRYKDENDYMGLNVTRLYRNDKYIKKQEGRLVRFYYELVLPLAYKLKEKGENQFNGEINIYQDKHEID